MRETIHFPLDSGPAQEGTVLIKKAGQLLTMRGEQNSDIGLIEGGSLLIQQGIIKAVGTEQEVETYLAQQGLPLPPAIDAAGKVVMPGFVDCHTHTVFGGSRVQAYSAGLSDPDPYVLERLGIPTGIHASAAMTASLSRETIKSQTKKRLSNMVQNGTTTVEIKSGYGLTTESELSLLHICRELGEELPLTISPTFLGAHGWPDDMAKDDYISLLCSEMIPLAAEGQLADCCDVWCDEGHFTAKESERILSCGLDYGLKPRIHTDAYSYIGGSDLAADMRMLSADHLNYTPPSLYGRLRDAGVTGVLLTGTDFAVSHSRPSRPRLMLEAGMDLALATNCCPGCWAESMIFIMTLACRLHQMSPAEAVRAATKGGAKAMGLSDRGFLSPGAVGDILILDTDTYENLVYQYGRNPVEVVIKGGHISFSHLNPSAWTDSIGEPLRRPEAQPWH